MIHSYAWSSGGGPPPGLVPACTALGYGNVLMFHSLSKRSSAPGLRSGFVAGDPALIEKFRRLRDVAGATVPMPVMAASGALWRCHAHAGETPAPCPAKFAPPGAPRAGRVAFSAPGRGVFPRADVGDGEAATRRLWTEAGLRVLPGAYLADDDRDGHNPGAAFIRVALVHDQATTTEALERLLAVLR